MDVSVPFHKKVPLLKNNEYHISGRNTREKGDILRELGKFITSFGLRVAG